MDDVSNEALFLQNPYKTSEGKPVSKVDRAYSEGPNGRQNKPNVRRIWEAQLWLHAENFCSPQRVLVVQRVHGQRKEVLDR